MTEPTPTTNDTVNAPADAPADVPAVADTSSTPAHDAADDSAGYEFVRLPNGKVVAVPKADVQEVPETATQTLPAAAMVPVEDPHHYVWLANGDVIRVKESDLPGYAGVGAVHGYWRKDDKLFHIVNVVPVETTVKD